MKWPWENRERIITSVDGSVTLTEVEFLRACLKEANQANADLSERLLSLKMAGAVEVPRVVGTVPCPPECNEKSPHVHHPGITALREGDELRDLIDAKSGGNLRKRGMMLRQLAADRAEGVDPDTIRAAIEGGIEGNGVPS